MLFTNYYGDRDPVVGLYGNPMQAVKKTRLLGVVLDGQLTMKAHFQKLMKQGRGRIRQLSCVALTLALDLLNYLLGICMLPTSGQCLTMQRQFGTR